MRKLLVVAARDYLAAVRTKSFLIGLLIMPLMMGGSVLVQYLLKDVRDVRDKHFAVVDRSPDGKLAAALVAAAAKREVNDPETKKQVRPRFVIEPVSPAEGLAGAHEGTAGGPGEQRVELSERVRRGELFGFLEIGPDVLRPPPPGAAPDERAELRYQTNSPTYQAFPTWAERVLTEAVQEQRAAAAGLPPGAIRVLVRPAQLKTKGLSRRTATGIEEPPEKDPIVEMVLPSGISVFMFMMILLGSTPLLQGVVEEKMQRIAEVLLGSVPPFQLMLGKILGTVGVSLTLAGVYLGGGYWTAYTYGYAAYLPVELLAWFVAYLVLAVTLYGSLFIAVGAACTDMRETQNLLWPVMLLATLPMFFLTSVLREPNSTLAQTVSFFPPATPMLMLVRQAVPPGVPAWQPAVGVVLVLATTALCVWVAGRIFRVGILMQGKGARLGEMVKWVFRG
jgi:ABC-2 type transport system permease protein